MKTISNDNAITRRQSITASILRISVPGAMVGGILLILYFVIVKSLGYQLQTNLRWINYIIVLPVSAYSIIKYINTTTEKSYLSAMLHSIVSCLGSFVILALFMFIYLFVDQTFMYQLHQLAYPELQINQLSIFILIIGEGILGSVLVSFIVLQFFKYRIRD